MLSVLLLIALPTAALDSDISSDSESKGVFGIQQDESDSANLRIIPNEASVGSDHVILVSDLNAGEEVTIRIIYDETGNEVYETSQLADSRGRLEVNIFTEASDPSGDYTVEVLNASDDVIASETLLVLDATMFDTQLSVEPSEGEAGSTFLIEVTDIEPFADLEIVIINEGGDEVFSTPIRATVDGDALIEFESSVATTGNLTITVVQDETLEIATGTIIVQEQDFNATVVIDPSEALPGNTVFVTVSGLEPESSVTLDIALDDVSVFSQEEIANISGLLIVPFTLADDAELGNYVVTVTQDAELLGRSLLLVDIPPIDVTVTPPVGTVGTRFLVSAAGLQAGEEVLIQLLDGETVVQEYSSIADANGEVRASLGQRIVLDVGNYAVRVIRRDELAFSQPVEIAEERPATEIAINPDNVVLSVSPESGVAPTDYTLSVEGLPADTNVTFFLLFDGASVFSTGGTTDDTGTFSTVVTSEESDPEGTYTLEARVDGEVIGSTEFAIGEAAVTDNDDNEATDDVVALGDLALSVSPQVVQQGERVEIIVSDLTVDEVVTVEVSLDDETIFSSERTADSNGNVAVGLRASDDDELATYTVSILRDGETIAEAEFDIVASDASVSDVAISIEPESGAIGTDHIVNVTGLAPEEAFEITVALDGEVVFEAERQADEDGNFTIVLTSSEDDALGTYDVTVIREDEAISSSLTITEGAGDIVNQLDDNDDETSEVSIEISPDEGALETDHTVEVSGLEANEAFTFVIEYDGDVVYEAEREADDDGNYSTVVSTVESDPIGDYEIIIDRDDNDDVSAILTVLGDEDETVDSGDFEVTVSPDSGEIGTEYSFTVTGLDPEEEIDIVVEFDGEAVFEATRQADGNGIFTIDLTTSASDEPGEYRFIVFRGDASAAEVSFIVEDDDRGTAADTGEADISINPETGPVGTVHEVVITGLNPDEVVTLIVRFEDEAVFSTELTANDDGVAEIPLESDEGDEAGDYSVEILRDDEVIAIGTLEISREITDTGDDEDSDTDEVETGSGGGDDADAVDAVTDASNDEDSDTDAVETGSGGDNDDGAIPFLQDNLSRDTPQIEYTFTGEEGDTVLLSLISNDFDTYLILLDDNGLELNFNDDSNGTLNSQIGPYDLPYSGEYTAVISSFGFINGGEVGIGSFTLTVETVALIDADYGERTDVSFDDDAGTYFIEFEGQAGDVISINVDSNESVDTVATLLSPSGFTLATDDDGGVGLNPEIERLILSETGIHTLQLSAFTLGDAGDVEVVITLNEMRTLDDDEAIDIRLTRKQFDDILVFEGEAGDVVSLTIELEAGDIDSFTVIAEQNQVILMNYQTFGLPTTITLGFVVPADGTVLVRVQDNGNPNAELNASIDRE